MVLSFGRQSEKPKIDNFPSGVIIFRNVFPEFLFGQLQLPTLIHSMMSVTFSSKTSLVSYNKINVILVDNESKRHTTQSQRFKIPAVGRAFSNCALLCQISVDSKSNRTNFSKGSDPALNSTVPIYTPGWRKAMFKNTTYVPGQGSNPENST